MKRIVGLAITLLIWVGASAPVLAADPRPIVYIFGAAECSFCQNALTFLRKSSREDVGFDLREFDVVRSSEDATLFVRFITAVGMREAHIPMVVVGRDIMLGYDTDDTSGREMRAKIEACRVETCLDVVGMFIRGGGPPEILSNAAWTEYRRWAGSSVRKSKQQLANIRPSRP